MLWINWHFLWTKFKENLEKPLLFIEKDKRNWNEEPKKDAPNFFILSEETNKYFKAWQQLLEDSLEYVSSSLFCLQNHFVRQTKLLRLNTYFGITSIKALN